MIKNVFIFFGDGSCTTVFPTSTEMGFEEQQLTILERKVESFGAYLLGPLDQKFLCFRCRNRRHDDVWCNKISEQVVFAGLRECVKRFVSMGVVELSDRFVLGN